MAMHEGVKLLTLKTLNDETVAWAEQDYHRRVHRELYITPLKRLLDSDDASRPCLVRDEARGGVPHHREEYAAALGRKPVA